MDHDRVRGVFSRAVAMNLIVRLDSKLGCLLGRERYPSKWGWSMLVAHIVWEWLLGHCAVPNPIIFFVYGFYPSRRHLSFSQGDQVWIQYLSHDTVFIKALDEVVSDGIIRQMVSYELCNYCLKSMDIRVYVLGWTLADTVGATNALCWTVSGQIWQRKAAWSVCQSANVLGACE